MVIPTDFLLLSNIGEILAHFSKGYKKKRDFRFNHEWEAARFSFKSL